MTYLDRSVRMRSRRDDISEEEFRAYIVKHIVEWEEEDIPTLVNYFEIIDKLFDKFFIKFPNPIHMIQTTGKEDVPDAHAYCRKNTIVLDEDSVLDTFFNPDGLLDLLIHELFHIQSQNDSEKRKKLYELIGFRECNEIMIPPELRSKRLTNPDAPKLNARINVTINGEKHDVVLVLLYNDRRCGRSFFSKMYVKMLAITNVGSSENEEWKYIEKDGQAVTFKLSDCSDFESQVGTNTSYNIHPEEILAENFRFMVTEASVPMPQITDGIRTIFLKA